MNRFIIEKTTSDKLKSDDVLINKRGLISLIIAAPNKNKAHEFTLFLIKEGFLQNSDLEYILMKWRQ